MARRSISDAALARARRGEPGSIPSELFSGSSQSEPAPRALNHSDPGSHSDEPLAILTELLSSPRWEEIVTKLRAIVENAGAPPPSDSRVVEDTVDVGDLRIERHAHRVLVGGGEVALTSLEFRLLVTLVDRRGRVQSRGVLLNDVWGLPSSSRTRTVDTHVRRLRDKLGATGQFIHSVRGVGYRFSDRLSVGHADGRAKLLAQSPSKQQRSSLAG